MDDITVAEIKARLKKYNLSTDGRKEVLWKRLIGSPDYKKAAARESSRVVRRQVPSRFSSPLVKAAATTKIEEVSESDTDADGWSSDRDSISDTGSEESFTEAHLSPQHLKRLERARERKRDYENDRRVLTESQSLSHPLKAISNSAKEIIHVIRSMISGALSNYVAIVLGVIVIVAVMLVVNRYVEEIGWNHIIWFVVGIFSYFSVGIGMPTYLLCLLPYTFVLSMGVWTCGSFDNLRILAPTVLSYIYPQVQCISAPPAKSVLHLFSVGYELLDGLVPVVICYALGSVVSELIQWAIAYNAHGEVDLKKEDVGIASSIPTLYFASVFRVGYPMNSRSIGMIYGHYSREFGAKKSVSVFVTVMSLGRVMGVLFMVGFGVLIASVPALSKILEYIPVIGVDALKSIVMSGSAHELVHTVMISVVIGVIIVAMVDFVRKSSEAFAMRQLEIKHAILRKKEYDALTPARKSY